MNCSRIQLLLAKYVTPASRDPEVNWQPIEAHVRGCRACAAQAAKMRRAIWVLRNTPDVLAGRAGEKAFSRQDWPRWPAPSMTAGGLRGLPTTPTVPDCGSNSSELAQTMSIQLNQPVDQKCANRGQIR